MLIKTLAPSLAVAIFLIWSFSLKTRLNKTKDKLESAKTQILQHKKRCDSLVIVVKAVTNESKLDSSNNAKMIVSLQGLIRNMKARTDTCKADFERLASGAYCFRVNMFGKKKLVKCNE
jgi:hypothetical protein